MIKLVLALVVIKVFILAVLSIYFRRTGYISKNSFYIYRFVVLLLMLFLLLALFIYSKNSDKEVNVDYDSFISDIEKMKGVTVTKKDAKDIKRYLELGEETEYIEIFLTEPGKESRVYKAVYKVIPPEVHFFSEKEEGVYIKINSK